ncbi:MAG: hypothetical protein GX915_09790 [Clostridiales bacterium]|nr:hypothetical protein [Clostridiales bacterium]
MLKERGKFIFKITIIHIITYVICGIIFMLLFDYQSTLSHAGMRDTNSIIVGLSPVFQIVRGALFGIVLWLFRNSFINSKYGWLIIWVMIVIVGIFNTPSTAPGSIEYFIYYEPVSELWNLDIGGMLEILTQTFLFSTISFYVVKPRTK